MAAGVSPIQVPLTNGTVWSFAHVQIEVNGFRMNAGFTEIKRRRTREREMVYSNHPDPVGKTEGQNKYECSAKYYVAWWKALMDQITANNVQGGAGSPGYGNVMFNLLISYQQPVIVTGGLQSFTDVVLGCTFDSTDADDSVGTNALVREVNFNPLKILFNGLDDYPDPLGTV